MPAALFGKLLGSSRTISRVEILLPFLHGLAHLGLRFPTHKGEGANTCPGVVVRWWVSDRPPQMSRTQVSQELARKVGPQALPRPAESEVPGLGSVVSMNTTPGGSWCTLDDAVRLVASPAHAGTTRDSDTCSPGAPGCRCPGRRDNGAHTEGGGHAGRVLLWGGV